MGTEEKESLPVNDPEAGYLPPEPVEGVGTGTLPPEEQEAIDAQKKEYEEQFKAVADHEDEVAKKRAKEVEGETAETTKEAPKSAAKSGSS